VKRTNGCAQWGETMNNQQMKLKVFAARLRYLLSQIEGGTLDMKSFADIFALDQDLGAEAFFQGELRLRDDYEKALRMLASQGNAGAKAALTSVANKQLDESAIAEILKKT
jgi:hypothetical protein